MATDADAMTAALIWAMTAHLAWTALLYGALTVARAPAVWGVGQAEDGSNPFQLYEPRLTANLRNQFEWPVFFYVACIMLLSGGRPVEAAHVALAWAFVVGRVLHSGVQILTAQIRLRGIVFTLNFVAVLLLWAAVFHL